MSAEQEVIRLVVRADLEEVVDDDTCAVLTALVEQVNDPRHPLHVLQRFLPLATLRVDPDGIFTAASGAALERIGLGHGELVGTSPDLWGAKASRNFAEVSEGHAQVFDAEGVVGDLEFRFRLFSVPDGNGGTASLVVDLNDVLAAEKSLLADRELLFAAMEEAGSGIFLQNAQGQLLSHNAVANEIFGQPVPDLFGDAARVEAFDAVHQDGRRFQIDDFPGRVALRTGEPQRNVVMGIRRPDGERRWLSVSSSPIRLHDDQAVITSLTDVTDRGLTSIVLRDSEERFRLLAERAPLGILILDTERRVLYVNPQAEEISGRTSPEILEAGWDALRHPDDNGHGRDDDPEGLPVEYRVVRADGTTRWVRARGAEIYGRDGTVIGTVLTAADITELRRTDERLKESEERTRAIVETAAEGIVTIDETGRIVEFNAAAEELFGYDSDEVIGRTDLLELFPPEDRQRLEEHFRDYLAGGPSRFIGRAPAEITGLRKDGSLVPIELAVTELTTSEGRLFTGLMRDMSERKAFEQELEHLATHDALTGLPNRALLTAQLESALARANRHETSVGVLFVDIDRMKLVTEALGHRAGDDLLLQAAARLRDTTGPSATLARFANDQFVVFIEDVDDVGDAVDVATRIIEHINEPFLVAGEEAFVNASVGIAFAPDGMSTAESLVSNADVAMGRAKSSSVTRYEVFDTDMRAWVETQRRTEIALRHGIERDEFELHYQPVVALEDLAVCGFEALVRWRHPHLGLLPPAEFVPVAEDSGLIVPMGEWILREAIRQSARWQQTYGPGGRDLCVAINLSARQIAQPGLASIVGSALEAVDVDPSCVAFEITETALLEDVDTVERTLTELKDLGVQLSLDDFGTGYSSLTYLCRLPIDIVKVDRSFVSQLGTGSRDASIVEMVVGMARTLQLDVVAEGVESEEQADVLRGWGCKFAQGYLFSKPKPVDEVEQLLEQLHAGHPIRG